MGQLKTCICNNNKSWFSGKLHAASQGQGKGQQKWVTSTMEYCVTKPGIHWQMSSQKAKRQIFVNLQLEDIINSRETSATNAENHQLSKYDQGKSATGLIGLDQHSSPMTTQTSTCYKTLLHSFIFTNPSLVFMICEHDVYNLFKRLWILESLKPIHLCLPWWPTDKMRIFLRNPTKH